MTKKELAMMTNKPATLHKKEPLTINYTTNIVVPGAITFGMIMLFIALRFVDNYQFLIAGV